MLLKELRANFYSVLTDTYPETEIQSFFNLLADAYLDMKRIDVSLNLSQNISEQNLEKFEKALHRLKNHEPIQYILGETAFFGLPFKVNDNTLIPRPETEELVAWILETSTEASNILDIGTGTGCIAISLAKNIPGAQVFAVDVSPGALDVAKNNARLNSVALNFFELDILSWAQNYQNVAFAEVKFDVIVSNPPYVRTQEKSQMQANVLDFEPDLALFVTDDDPLIFYRSISDFAGQYLKKGGRLFFEINQYLGKEMSALMIDSGFADVTIKRDIFGNDRMISGIKNN